MPVATDGAVALASRVSVVLPTYNRSHVLGRAIESVLRQTYADFELIVVDDGSTDATEHLVRSIPDRRLRYRRHHQRRGAAAARNTGIECSRGVFVAFQDSDDVWLPEKLALQVAAFGHAKPGTAVVYCGFRASGPHSLIEQPTRLRRLASRLPLANTRLQGDIGPALLHGNWITTQTALLRRVALLYIGGFDEQLPRFQDWDLWLRLARHYTFEYLDRVLVHTFVSADSLSSRSDTLIPAFERLLQNHATGHSQARGLVAHYEYALGSRAYRRRQHRPAVYHLLRAVWLCPRNSTYWFSLATALLRRPGLIPASGYR